MATDQIAAGNQLGDNCPLGERAVENLRSLLELAHSEITLFTGDETLPLNRLLLDALLSLLETHRPDLFAHAQRVALLCFGMGRHIGWSHRHTLTLATAGMLHQVGTLTRDENFKFWETIGSAEELKERRVLVDLLQACHADSDLLDLLELSHNFGYRAPQPEERTRHVIEGAACLQLADLFDSVRQLPHSAPYTAEEIVGALQAIAEMPAETLALDALQAWLRDDPRDREMLDPKLFQVVALAEDPDTAEEVRSVFLRILRELRRIQNDFDGFFLLDSTGHFQLWSSGCAHVWGRSVREMRNKYWTNPEMGYCNEEGIAFSDSQTPLYRTLETARRATTVLYLRTAQGDLRECDVTSVPLIGQDRLLQGIVELHKLTRPLPKSDDSALYEPQWLSELAGELAASAHVLDEDPTTESAWDSFLMQTESSLSFRQVLEPPEIEELSLPYPAEGEAAVAESEKEDTTPAPSPLEAVSDHEAIHDAAEAASPIDSHEPAPGTAERPDAASPSDHVEPAVAEADVLAEPVHDSVEIESVANQELLVSESDRGSEFGSGIVGEIASETLPEHVVPTSESPEDVLDLVAEVEPTLAGSEDTSARDDMLASLVGETSSPAALMPIEASETSAATSEHEWLVENSPVAQVSEGGVIAEEPPATPDVEIVETASNGEDFSQENNKAPSGSEPGNELAEATGVDEIVEETPAESVLAGETPTSHAEHFADPLDQLFFRFDKLVDEVTADEAVSADVEPAETEPESVDALVEDEVAALPESPLDEPTMESVVDDVVPQDDHEVSADDGSDWILGGDDEGHLPEGSGPQSDFVLTGMDDREELSNLPYENVTAETTETPMDELTEPEVSGETQELASEAVVPPESETPIELGLAESAAELPAADEMRSEQPHVEAAEVSERSLEVSESELSAPVEPVAEVEASGPTLEESFAEPSLTEQLAAEQDSAETISGAETESVIEPVAEPVAASPNLPIPSAIPSDPMVAESARPESPISPPADELHPVAASAEPVTPTPKPVEPTVPAATEPPAELLAEPVSRSEWEAFASHLFSRREEAQESFAVLFVDIDHFGAINKEFGRTIGDDLIQEVDRRIIGFCERDELSCRLGGEQFVVACPGSDKKNALARAERIRKLIASTKFDVLPFQKLTVSIGVSVAEDQDDLKRLLDRCEEALSRAKRAGRNACAALSSDEIQETPPESPSGVEPASKPMQIDATFEAFIASNMIIYKLGGFLYDSHAKLLKVDKRHVAIRVGKKGLFPYWGKQPESQPVLIDLELAEDWDKAKTVKSSIAQTTIRVRMRPDGWVRKQDVFEQRALQILRDLKAYFAAR